MFVLHHGRSAVESLPSRTAGKWLTPLGLLLLASALLGVAGCSNAEQEDDTPSAALVTAGASQKGGPAPSFVLTDAYGQRVELAQRVRESDAVVLVFYRGFF